MAPPLTAIKDGLIRYNAIFLALVLGVGIVSGFSLASAKRHTNEIHDRWLVGTEMLGELSDRISEFRLAEAYLSLARQPEELAEAKDLINDHRAAIEGLQAKYSDLAGERAAPDVKVLSKAWTEYLRGHNEWIASVKMDAGPAMLGRPLHQLYRVTDEAVDHVIEVNSAAADTESSEANAIVDFAVKVTIAVAVAATILTFMIFLKVKSRIAGPLTKITEALTRLAAGDRSVRVPWADRNDEIGKMAQAMERFRENAVALEHAHEATRQAQKRADSLARHDALTGLPNRRVFKSAIESAITKSNSHFHALLLIDPDKFKPINDLLGHAVGDLVLCEIASRIGEIAGKGDTVARLEGDELAIVVICPKDPLERGSALMSLAQKWSPGWPSRSCPATTGLRSGRALASPLALPMDRTQRHFCGQPISPCTAPSGTAGARTVSSNRAWTRKFAPWPGNAGFGSALNSLIHLRRTFS